MNSALLELAVFFAISVLAAVIAHFSLRRYYTASIISTIGANIAFNFINCRYMAGLDYFWPPAVIIGIILALLIALIIGLPISRNRCIHVRQWLWATMGGLAIGIALPIPIWNAQFKGVDGYYLRAQCMGGHDIFTELRKGQCFETCPGHKDRSLQGTFLRTGNHWEIVVNSSTATIYQADSNGYITFKPVSNTHEFTLQRVRNPWRIWLPWILPE